MNGTFTGASLVRSTVCSSTAEGVTLLASRLPRVRPDCWRVMAATTWSAVNGSPLPKVTSSRRVTVHSVPSSFCSHSVAM